MSQDIARREVPQVPDLAYTPAVQITADDIALPRIRIAHFSSAAVQDGLVKAGDLYYTIGREDPEPTVLDQGFRFYVLGLRKGKSFSDGGDLMRWDFSDPAAPAEAWTTYDYTLAIPEAEECFPFKMLFTKSGQPAAQQINFMLKKQAIAGPSWINGFRIETAMRENKKGKWYVPRVKPVAADPDEVKVAEGLAVMAAAAPEPTYQSRTDEPAI